MYEVEEWELIPPAPTLEPVWDEKACCCIFDGRGMDCCEYCLDYQREWDEWAYKLTHIDRT